MMIDSLHLLDSEAVQIVSRNTAYGGLDAVQVLEDAEKIIKASAGLLITELQGVPTIAKIGGA